MNKYLVILLSLLFPCVLLAQNEGIRVVDNKGTIIYVDPSKWYQVGSNLFNKNTTGNVAIGLDRLNASFNSRLYISNGGSTTLPVLKLDTPFTGALTDNVLTWDPTDFSVRKIDITKLSPNDWHLSGNAGTDPATNFLGTTDNQDLSFRTNNTEKIRVTTAGDLIPTGTVFGSSGLAANRWKGVFSNYLDMEGGTGNVSVSTIPNDNNMLNLNNPNGGSVVMTMTSTGGGGKHIHLGINPTINSGNGVFVIGHPGNTTAFQVDLANGNTAMSTQPDPSAVLNLGTNNRGLLLSQVPLTTTTTWGLLGTTTREGMLVYNTNSTITGPGANGAGIYFWNGTRWTYINNSATSADINWFQGGNTLTADKTFGTLSSNNLPFITNNTERMRITSTGNIGIGTTAPANTLEINSTTANTSGLRLTNLTSASPASAGTTIGVNATGDVVVVSSPATTVSNTSNANLLHTTVNDITGADVNIINSNTLTAANGNLVSTINGIASTPPVSVLISANNGLTVASGNVQLGGSLIKPTTIATDATNTLAISGLQTVVAPTTDNLVTVDGIGNLHKRTVADAVGTIGWLTTGNTGTIANPTSTTSNFIGTRDNTALNFRINNVHAGWIGYQTAGPGTASVYFGVNAGLAAAPITGLIGGYSNVGIGDNALAANISNGNVAIGANSLLKTNNKNNTAVGEYSLQSNTMGDSNTGVGNSVLLYNLTGSMNAAFGNSAGVTNTTGSNNTFIGSGADATVNNLSKAVAIGNNAKVAASNSMVLGGTGADAVKVGIGNTTPSNSLHVTATVDPVRFVGLQASVTPATDQIIVADATGVLKTISPTAYSEPWQVASSITPATLNTQNIYQNANVGIGDFSTANPIANLDVKGSVRTGTNTSNAIGTNSFAGGTNSIASAPNSFAFGSGATASGTTGSSAAFGSAVANAAGGFAFAAGAATASATFSTAFGNATTLVAGNSSFAAGNGNKVYANNAAAVGVGNIINITPTATVAAAGSFAAGNQNIINSPNSVALGTNNSINSTYTNPQGSVALGAGNFTDGNASIALGANHHNYGDGAVTMGNNNSIANGSSYSVAMGNNNQIIGTTIGALVAGQQNIVNGTFSTTIGQNNSIGVAGTPSPSGTIIGSYANIPAGISGSSILADNLAPVVNATANYQFTGMFNGGYRLLTNRADLTKGMVMDNVGNASFSGTVTTSASVIFSDIRLKKDIQTLTGVLDNIKQLRGVNYYWKDPSKGNNLQLGMIAQELEKVYPELVLTNKDTGFKAVNYPQFTGVLLQGIKEQQTQIEDLKTEVDELKKQMQEIKDLLKK